MPEATTTTKLPVYLKLAQVTMGVLALFFILYIGQDILIPLVFALLLAILLNPFVVFLEKKGMNRVVSILLAILITIILTAGVLYFIGSQMSRFSESIPAFKEKFGIMYKEIFQWVHEKFNIKNSQIEEWVAKSKKNGLDNAGNVLHSTLTTVSSVLVVLFLLPVYVFFFLFYKTLLLEFIARLFKHGDQAKVIEVLDSTKSLIQSYLIGLLTEAGLVAILNSVGLLIIGLDYAILFGVIGALLNVIPYIGGIIAIALPMLMAIATKSYSSALLVFGVYMLVQFIDNNFLVPKIVASKVKINALISIVVVLVGGALWGVSGMFLSIPITAIMKVIFDRIPELEPFGFLIGDSMPSAGYQMFKKKRASPKISK